MHEVSLVVEVLRILEEASVAHGFRRVHRVVLEVDALAAVDEDALRFAFDAEREGTLAAGATLETRSLPAQGTCRSCGQVSPVDDRLAACPACGDVPLEVRGGTGLRVVSVDAA